VRAAREVGELILADGNIPQAWPYFRAIGETAPIVEALDTFEARNPTTPDAQEALGATIQIAFQEGLHRRKGFELILEHYGLCRAITMFDGYPEREGRQESLRLLVCSLHNQIFSKSGHYADSSHLAPVLKYSAELDDIETLKLAVDIAEYGARLDPMFQFADDPPFENTYTDHGIYLRALAGQDVDVAVRHFEQKAAGWDPNYGSRPAEVLVKLLVRLSRYDAAIKTFQRYLSDVEPAELSCPSLPQLCQMAGDFEQLKKIAQEQRDPLSYMAALIQGVRGKGQGVRGKG